MNEVNNFDPRARSVINPIVYAFLSKHFRDSFLAAACGGRWLCCSRRGYRTPVNRHASLSQTRTTSVRWGMPLLSLTNTRPLDKSARRRDQTVTLFPAQRWLRSEANTSPTRFFPKETLAMFSFLPPIRYFLAKVLHGLGYWGKLERYWGQF